MKIISNVGFILLAVYLILVGVMATTAIAIPSMVMGIIAIVSGVFILLGR